MSNEKKLTPIAMAVEEIKNELIAPTSEFAVKYNEGLKKAIKIIEGLKEYERECISYSFDQGFEDRFIDGNEYFDTTYTQEGGLG